MEVVGSRFARLTVLGETTRHVFPSGKSARQFICRCDCGTEKIVLLQSLRAENTKSCGCLVIERVRLPKTHGATTNFYKTVEYRAWQNMRMRCENPNSTRYKRYGGRGIVVADRWRKSFQNFIDDMGSRPSPNHSLDRINPEQGYGPDNCRWATVSEQQNNRTNNRFLSVFPHRISASDALRLSGSPISISTFTVRLEKGWELDKALMTPPAPPHQRRKKGIPWPSSPQIL